MENKTTEEATGAKSSATAAAVDDLEMDEDCDFDEEESLGMCDFVEASSDDEEYRMTMDEMFGVPNTPTRKDAAKGIKAGYSKFSIEDMMNHESPKGKASTPAPAPIPASPPLSERSVPLCGYNKKKNASPVLDITSILNNTPPPSLKRKRQSTETPTPVIPPAPVFVEQTLPDAPGVVVDKVAYPALPADTVSSQEEVVEEEVEGRPSKRVKSERRGTSYTGLAAATMVGFVMGGVGMFAALVASAQ